VGVCNPCSTAFDFSTGEKQAIPILEAVAEVPPGGEIRRLPFVRFDAVGAAVRAPVFVMAFAISRIGTPLDDGAALTMDRKALTLRPGRVDSPPELRIETAAGLARFLALRVLDPDGKVGLRPEGVVLASPAIVAVRFRVTSVGFTDPISGVTLSAEALYQSA
jgi:hypothetical protein